MSPFTFYKLQFGLQWEENLRPKPKKTKEDASIQCIVKSLDTFGVRKYLSSSYVQLLTVAEGGHDNEQLS